MLREIFRFIQNTSITDIFNYTKEVLVTLRSLYSKIHVQNYLKIGCSNQHAINSPFMRHLNFPTQPCRTHNSQDIISYKTTVSHNFWCSQNTHHLLFIQDFLYKTITSNCTTSNNFHSTSWSYLKYKLFRGAMLLNISSRL